MNRKICVLSIMVLAIVILMLTSCSRNKIKANDYTLVYPDSTSFGEPFIHSNYVCLFTIEDSDGNKYKLHMKPQKKAVKPSYKRVRVGDKMHIELQMNKKYPKFDPYYLDPKFGEGNTIQDRLGTLYKSDNIINIRGKLYIKN